MFCGARRDQSAYAMLLLLLVVPIRIPQLFSVGEIKTEMNSIQLQADLKVCAAFDARFWIVWDLRHHNKRSLNDWIWIKSMI